MKCNEIRELMPDLASGLAAVTPEVKAHLGCLRGMRRQARGVPPDHGTAGRVAGAGTIAVF